MLRPSLATLALVLGAWLAGLSAASAQSLVPCADENGFCRVPYPTRVIYGAHGRRAAVEVQGRGVPCSNEVFGDPAPGIRKRCAYVSREDRGGWPVSRHPQRYGFDDGSARWRTCAGENGFCGFRGSRRVRYGAQGRFVEGFYRGGVGCNNGTFGDPVPGVRKFCQVLD